MLLASRAVHASGSAGCEHTPLFSVLAVVCFALAVQHPLPRRFYHIFVQTAYMKFLPTYSVAA
jgi:hypothetical protein